MDQAIIEQILEKTDIVEVIGSYIPLKRAGSNFKARCPFHDEKTPSFVVSEKKQIFKCFGCGIAGNAITFVRNYEKISYIEAVKKLAVMAGVSIGFEKTILTSKTQKDILYSIYEHANTFFRENLKLHGDFAREYLQERSISPETIEKFNIGYSHNSYNALFNYLLKNDIKPKVLAVSGLFTNSKKGLIDTFRDRLMFPIHSITGKIVAFGGRILREQQNTGKYINSPTTEIYTKGNELYGLYQTRYEIAKKKYALICEGYTDFLRLFENGFTNVVASLGTSLTEKQISLLGRYSTNFMIIYDGDKAGTKATLRAASEILKKGFNPQIISLPEEDDPDSFLIKYGAEKMEKQISASLSLINFLFQEKKLKLSEKEKIDYILEAVNEMNDPISKEIIIKDISETFSLSSRSLLTNMHRKEKYRRQESNKQVINQNLGKYQEERDLLKMMVNVISIHKKVAQEINSSYFLSDNYKKIYENILYQLPLGMNHSAIIELFDDEETKKTVADLLIDEFREISLDDLLKALKLRKYKYEIKIIDKKMLKEKENRELLTEKKKLTDKIRKLSKKVVRKTLY